jgi:ABC-2 type transport system ATP-binding protein
MSVVLEVNHLSKKYGSRLSVDDVSFTLNSGEVVGFLGPNGAGKTTTMRMIAGLISPTGGNVKLLGKSVPSDALKHMGAMIEEPSFYPYLSGRDNLRYAAKLHGGISEKRIEETLELTGMKARGSDRVAKYSQGMRQRLGLARALLSSPQLLMLDEPANGLDPEGIAELREVIKSFGDQGITVFVSSHILSEVEKFAPRVLIINKGKLLRDGGSHDLRPQTADGLDTVYHLETADAPKALEVLRREPYIQNLELMQNGLSLRLPRAAAYRLAPLLVQSGVMFTQLSRTESFGQQSDLESLYLEVIGDQGNAGGVK